MSHGPSISHSPLAPEFLYPVPFNDFVATQFQTESNNTTQHKLREYHRLVKMRKMLACTAQKMSNRIRLFKQTSQKIVKKRELEFKAFEKIENIKNHPFFIERGKPKEEQQIQTADGRRNRNSPQHSSSNRIFAERVNEQRLKNAKSIMEDKERFKIIIQQRKKCDLQRKLQSANLIRRKRQHAKIVKEQYQNQLKESIKRNIEQKYEREKEELMELQYKMNELQLKEKEALISWKKTVEGIDVGVQEKE